MKRIVVAALLIAALAAAGCSRGQDAPSGFQGTVTLRSGSIPAPYAWSRTARVDGREVTIEDSPAGSETPTVTTRTLTDTDVTALAQLLARTPASSRADERPPGAGTAQVDLTPAGGRRTERTYSSSTAGYAIAEQLFDTLAGK